MTKTVIEDLRALRITKLNRWGCLRGPRCISTSWKNSLDEITAKAEICTDANDVGGAVQIDYRPVTETGRNPPTSMIVELTTTPCHFGGVRYWFICPNEQCRRRIGVLVFNGLNVGCRTCFRLTYRSRNENRRNASYALYRAALTCKELSEAEESGARCSYAGKLTKKAQRILKRGRRSSAGFAHYWPR